MAPVWFSNHILEIVRSRYDHQSKAYYDLQNFIQFSNNSDPTFQLTEEGVHAVDDLIRTLNQNQAKFMVSN